MCSCLILDELLQEEITDQKNSFTLILGVTLICTKESCQEAQHQDGHKEVDQANTTLLANNNNAHACCYFC